MKVLIVGSGGREHALVLLAAKSPVVTEVFCAPGNAGTAAMATNLDLEVSDINGLSAFALVEKIDLTIVGPEAPLAKGIVDEFQRFKLAIFGPTQAAAQLETSKDFAKMIMISGNIPTAWAKTFGPHQTNEALDYVFNHNFPLVIKANGLVAGKGVTICYTFQEAEKAIRDCQEKQVFGPAGETILVEDFVAGHPGVPRAELSILALVDIDGNFLMFPVAQDYKPVNDGDQGPNTGGMGSFAPVPWVTEKMMIEIAKRIFKPVIFQMKWLAKPFSGVLYAGLKYSPEGFKVLEFNVRFGDPELQPLAMLLKSDLIPALKTIADGGSIVDIKLEWKKGAAVCVVMASRGYPGSYKKGAEIKGLYPDGLHVGPFLQIFQAGTKWQAEERKLLTAGGRVLGITSYSVGGLDYAVKGAYQVVTEINWVDADNNGPYFRNDIGRSVPKSIN